MGTGMVEEMTGLPISGGSLRCEYAKAPTMFSMVLEHTALDFYEQNCIRCLHRKPTDATEHLGTWADALIAEREELRRQQEKALRQAMEERRRRHQERRLLLGAPNPTLQSILDLVDRIDAEARDVEAERLLLRHAEMSPGDFPDELIDHMTNESIAIGNDTLLESVIAVFQRQGRPDNARMLKVAFDAVGRGVAAAAAGRVVAAHAERFDVDDASLEGILLLAAGRTDDIGHPDRFGAEPAPLIHFYDLEPERAIQLLGAKLCNDEVQWRATAAHAADNLVGARPDAGSHLLSALLDSIQIPDNSLYLGDPFASGQVRNVIANVVANDPFKAAREIDNRLKTADVSYARQLWGCYHKAASRTHNEPLTKDVAETIVTRGIALLRQDLDPELLRDVANTFQLMACYRAGSLELPLAVAIEITLLWALRVEVYDASNPGTADAASPDQAILASLEWERKQIWLRSVLNDLKKVLEVCAASRPSDYVELVVATAWNGSATSQRARISLLDVLGSVVREQMLLDRAEPLLFDALESHQPGVRAAALRAFSKIGEHELPLPGELTDRVLAALMNDDVQAVVFAAIRAIRLIDIPAERTLDVVNWLLKFAQIYGPLRVYAEDVARAFRCVLQLSHGQTYEERATGVVLQLISAFPSFESGKLLDRLPLEHHAAWPATAVRALRLDPNPRYYGIGDHERQNLLRELAELPTDKLAPLFEELQEVGLERLPYDHIWAWAIADVLALHQQHARAATICDAVVAVLRDSREERPARRFARQIALGHHLDLAVSKGDVDARERLLQDWEHLAGETDD